jgi:hypothetical protein
MIWLLEIALGVVGVLASFSLLFVFISYPSDGSVVERQLEVLATRRAERQLHELSRTRFAAMLREARSLKLER